jgi:hypothetical protein
MAIANFLRSFFISAPKAGEYPFVVVCAYCPGGVSSEDGFVLRGLINSHHPTDWRFFNPGSFVALYASDSPEARGNAEALAASLRAFDQSPVLGVGIAEGILIAEFAANGQLSSWPIGGAINTATLMAHGEMV